MQRRLPALILAVAVFCWTGSVTHGGDLNDGISTYTEDKITKYDDLGDREKNVQFIVVDAITKADMADHDDDSITAVDTKGGGVNVNSVVVGTGGQTGDIYNINLGDGTTTAVSAGP